MRKDREHQEQKALIEMCDKAALKDDRFGDIYAIPNGGVRHIGVAVKLKAEGVRKGMLDLCLPVSNKYYHALYIEMKIKPNKLTPEQVETIIRLRKRGNAAGVCWSAIQAFEIIERYLASLPLASSLHSQ